MPSKARANLVERLKDIDQLLNAHTAITKFTKAEQAANAAGGQLAKIAEVIQALVSNPGRGKPKEVDAINRAAFVLSLAHFQGYVDELHAEIGRVLLSGKASDPDAVIKLVKPPRSNPHVNIINQMFAGIGIYDLMDAIKWKNCENKSVRSRLTSYLETRNKIAHGSKEAITKARVVQLKAFIEILANKLDDQVAAKASKLLGKQPW